MSDGRVIKGLHSAQQRNDFELIPNVGQRTILRKDFTSYDEATAWAASLYQSGSRASVRQKGDAPVWTVESSFEGDPDNQAEDLQDTHELRINLLNPDVKTNDYLREQFGVTYGAQDVGRNISAVEHYAANLGRSDDYITEYDIVAARLTGNEQSNPFHIDRGALAMQLLHLYLSGVNGYPEFQHVYVHTFNFGTQAQLTIDRFGVKKLFTKGGMVNDEGTPSILSVPDALYYKLPPEQTVMYGGRTLLKYEYWETESASALLYRLAGV